MVKTKTPVVRGAVTVVLAVIGSLALISAIPSLNPFGTETVDRSGPAVLKSIARLSEYRAATANLQVIVDVERDSRLLPSFIKGEKTLFVAGGSVDAFVRFDHPFVEVDEDRRSATIVLPPPSLAPARVDLSRSRVYDRDRGLVDRVESVFEDSPTEDASLIRLAERKLTAAAQADGAVLKAAERNTRAMLTQMLTGLGFTQVTVRFAAPSDSPAR